MIRILLPAVLSLCAVISCQRVETDLIGEATGYLYVSLDRDDSEELVFKSVSPDDLVFSLKVYNSLDQLVEEVPDYTDLASEPLVLKVGEYTVTASSAETSAEAAFDEPFYSGSAEFTVTPDDVSNVDITCFLANVKVTAEFSEEIKSMFGSYVLTVTNGKGTLTFSSEDGTVDREGYFSPTGTLTWTLSLVNNDGKKYDSLTETYTDVKARQHYNLSFALEEKEEFGGGGLRVVVDNSLTEKEYDLTLDFGDETVPQVTAGFEHTEGEAIELNAGDSTPKVISLVSEDGFRNVILTYGAAGSAGIMTKAAPAVQVDLVGASETVIADLAAAGIVTSSVEPGAASVSIDITGYIASQAIGETSVSLLAADVNGAFKETVFDFVLRSPVDVEAVSAEPWAMFATLKAKWFTENKPDGIAFQYRKSSESAWSDAMAVTPDAASRTYSAKVTGLDPETEYVFRAVTPEDLQTKEITFTTEAAGTLPNMGFDSWYQSGKAWYPNASADSFIWDSANGGTAALGTCPTTATSDVAVSGDGKQAAQLKSSVVFGQFAAGNIYTGQFGKATLSPVGAELDWGVPFTSRPVALKGYFKYAPASINYAKGDYASLKGTMDVGQIQIALTDWTGPFHISTGDNKFVDFDAPEIIAYASLELTGASDGYQPFVLELDYRDTSRTPTYIVIVAAASRYGDYYTGGEGSTLLIDEFEFVYDPDELKSE